MRSAGKSRRIDYGVPMARLGAARRHASMRNWIAERLRAMQFRYRYGIAPRIVAVHVDDHVIVFAVDPVADDPIAQAFLGGQLPGDASGELWRHLLHRGAIVIDAGANLGTYSLPAAAAGARVLAIEASPIHAALIELAVRRNDFEGVEILHAAAGSAAGTIGFTAQGPWGQVAVDGDQNAAEVTTVALDDVVRDRGWSHVSLVKIDVEGWELEVLAGMTGLLSREDAPHILIECNGHTLHHYGHSPMHLLATLEEFGYRCYLVELGADRRLVPVASTDIQPDCVADYLACKALPEGLAPWRVGAPLDEADVIRRVAATCMDPHQPVREYGERLIASAPAWLRNSEEIRKALST